MLMLLNAIFRSGNVYLERTRTREIGYVKQIDAFVSFEGTRIVLCVMIEPEIVVPGVRCRQVEQSRLYERDCSPQGALDLGATGDALTLSTTAGVCCASVAIWESIYLCSKTRLESLSARKSNVGDS